jgi:hypothetical protein
LIDVDDKATGTVVLVFVTTNWPGWIGCWARALTEPSNARARMILFISFAYTRWTVID